MIHITLCHKVVQTDPRTDTVDALIDLASGLPRVDLDAVLAEAAQQTRVDREYLLTPHQFRESPDCCVIRLAGIPVLPSAARLS